MNISVNPAKLVISADPETAQISTGSQIVKEYIECPVYEGPTEVTPSEEEQTLLTEGYRLESDVTISAIQSDYVGSGIPHEHSEDLTASGATVSAPAGYYEEAVSKAVQSGSVSVPDTTITADPSIQLASGTGIIRASVSTSKSISPYVNEGYVTSGESGSVTVSGEKSLSLNTVSGSTITPTESEQTAVDAYKWTTGEVKVGAIASDYVGSGITRNDSSDLTASGATVTAPAGFYATNASKAISNATWRGGSTIEYDPTISVGSDGLITASYTYNTTVKPLNGNGYATSGTSYPIKIQGEKTLQLTARDSDDLTASGATVTAPAGYYYEAAIKTISSGAEGTPTATKGTVTNHSVSVTPSVTNSAGYISGGTHNGSHVTVSASELVSGSQTVTANDTYDVTNLASITVAVQGSTPNLQAKTNIDPTTSSQTIQADSGYDGLASVQINAMPSGSATAPATISGASASVSTGTNTLTLSKTVSVTPSVSAGYVSSGTAGNSSVSLTASVTTKSAATITPTSSNKTISSGTYLTGTQTIEGIACTNLTAENIKSGITVKIGTASDDDSVTSVTGTYSGGGGSMNVQTNQTTTRRSNTALGSINSLTCSTAGKYDVYWNCYRTNTSSGYTWGSQLYIGGTAYGSENTTWTNNVQTNKLTGVTISANATVAVYGRSRSGSYYIYAPQLTIVQTA